MGNKLTDAWARIDEPLRVALAAIGVKPDELKPDTCDAAADGTPLPALIHEPTGLTLFATEDYLTDDRRKVTGFVASGSVIIPGKSYMPNGDPGYPDDVDTYDVGFLDLEQVRDVPEWFAAIVAKHLIDGALECWHENKMAEQYAEEDNI